MYNVELSCDKGVCNNYNNDKKSIEQEKETKRKN